MKSEEKYTALIERTKESFQADQPMFTPPMSPQLLQAVRKRRKDNGLRPLVSELMRYRIPVWQAASCVAGLFFLILISLGREGKQAPTVYVYLTDTIYKMIPAPVIEPDWSDSVARVLPTSHLDASLYQDSPANSDHMSRQFPAPNQSIAARVDTGQLIAYDSSLLRPIEFLINHSMGLPDQSLEHLSDSFQQIY